MGRVKDVKENPCNMCMPMGAILPFKGIEAGMVLLHGSQGCATYMRRHMAEHFNEPIDVASSSLNEKGTIYGGESHLRQGLDNLIRVYNPKVIGLLTTCLAETIGEDIEGIAYRYLQEKKLDLKIVPVSTPGYGGSHFEGYWSALRKVVEHLAVDETRHNGINIILPNLSTADIREIKKILALMKIEDYTLLPDISETLDRPYSSVYYKIPPGGTTLKCIEKMAGARATVQFGVTVDEAYCPGTFLKEKFGIPLFKLPIPIGLENTDSFVEVIKNLGGYPIPEVLTDERGRLLDCMIDSHKINFLGRGVIFGEPELVYAMTRTCLENGVHPAVVATGSKNPYLRGFMKGNHAGILGKVDFLEGTDFSVIRSKSREREVNLAIGSSEGKYLTEREGIPLVRIGYPIHDRMGGQRILSVGYQGTAVFIDKITNTLLESRQKLYRRSTYQKFFPGPKTKYSGSMEEDEQNGLFVYTNL